MTVGRLIRTARAEEDLIEIWTYIAADNPVAAEKLVDRIDAKCEILADSPRLGPARPDIAPNLRYFPVGRYLILYREICWRHRSCTCGSRCKASAGHRAILNITTYALTEIVKYA